MKGTDALLRKVAESEKRLENQVQGLAQARANLEAALRNLQNVAGTRDLDDAKELLDSLLDEQAEAESRMEELVEEVDEICPKHY